MSAKIKYDILLSSSRGCLPLTWESGVFSHISLIKIPLRLKTSYPFNLLTRTTRDLLLGMLAPMVLGLSNTNAV